MDRWTEIELFVQVAETGSLSRAAEALDLSNAAASRHLSALEERLSARLVERNTRRLYLTDTGQAFFNRAKSILLELKDAESAVNATALNPTGVLRISASLSFSLHHVAPLLREYTQRYPQVTVHIESANRYLDIIDVAIRTREMEADSNITIRRPAETRRILTASPRYLAQHGTPTTLEDLQRHKLLIYTHAHNANELRFTAVDYARCAVECVDGAWPFNGCKWMSALANREHVLQRGETSIWASKTAGFQRISTDCH